MVYLLINLLKIILLKLHRLWGRRTPNRIFTMKNHLINRINFLKITLFTTLCLLSSQIYAQIPRDIPSDTGPLTIDSTFDIILYIVLPVIVLIFFVVYLMSKRNKDRENRDR